MIYDSNLAIAEPSQWGRNVAQQIHAAKDVDPNPGGFANREANAGAYKMVFTHYLLNGSTPPAYVVTGQSTADDRRSTF